MVQQRGICQAFLVRSDGDIMGISWSDIIQSMIYDILYIIYSILYIILCIYIYIDNSINGDNHQFMYEFLLLGYSDDY